VEYLKQVKESLPSFVKVVDTVKCRGKEHLQEFCNGILSKGGEGVMLREAQSMYKAGRSQSLRKFKPFFDTEVKVLENKYPQGLVCLQ
jgi:DNA ligase-1